MPDYRLARLNRFFSSLQSLNQKLNHVFFRLWLGHLLHNSELALQALQVLVVFLLLLLHLSLRLFSDWFWGLAATYSGLLALEPATAFRLQVIWFGRAPLPFKSGVSTCGE